MFFVEWLNAVLLEESQGVGADFIGAVLNNAVAGTFDGDDFRILQGVLEAAHRAWHIEQVNAGPGQLDGKIYFAVVLPIGCSCVSGHVTETCAGIRNRKTVSELSWIIVGNIARVDGH